MMLPGLMSRCAMAAFSKTYWSARQTRLTMKIDSSMFGRWSASWWRAR
jgi:hypothetical protein